MENKDDLRSIIQAINKGDGTYPAMKLIGSGLTSSALMSKLIRDRDPTRYSKEETRRSTNIDASSMHHLSESIIRRTNDAENMLELFPDMELAAQILISSILSPKDMTETEINYTVEDSFLNAKLTGAFVDIIRTNMSSYYKLEQELPDIFKDCLFKSGSYVKCVIPESALDELINGSQFISTEDLTGLLFSKTGSDNTGDLQSLGILGPARREDPTTAPIKSTKNIVSFEGLGTYESTGFTHYEYGIAVPYTKANSEEKKLDLKVQVTDNFHLLRVPELIKKNKRLQMRKTLGRATRFPNHPGMRGRMGLEDTQLSSSEIENLIYKSSQTGAAPFVTVNTRKNAYRNSVGRPLLLKLPSEAVIPVHTPGDETDHIGFFLLIDNEGYPLSRHSADMNIEGLNGGLNMPTSDLQEFLMTKAKSNLIGNDTMTSFTFRDAARVYAGVVEDDLLSRLKNGIYNNNLEISRPEEVYNIMLARAFANKITRLVFVPAELITYFAYKYHENGIGKSLIDNMRILNSLRAMTMFARVMASLRNSIGITEVRLKLDERDTDPQKSIEVAIHEIMKTRQQYFPLGINSPSDLAEWVQRSGFEFTFEGHPKIPDMNFEFNQKGAQNVKPDEELDEELRKRSIMAMGLSPESVDNAFSAEFATTITQNNLLLSKRVLQIQLVFMPQITQHTRQIVLNDMVIYNELVELLEENQKDLQKSLTDEEKASFKENRFALYEIIIERMTEMLELSLPSPTSSTLESQMAALDIYTTALDKALDAWVSSDAFQADNAGDLYEHVDLMRASLRSYLVRKYMVENNILPELNELTLTDADDKPKIDFYDVQADYVKGFLKSFTKYIQSMVPTIKQQNKKLAEELDKITGGDDMGGGDMGDEGAPSDDEFGGDDTGGDTDDLGLDEEENQDEDAQIDQDEDQVSDDDQQDEEVADTDDKEDKENKKDDTE